VPMQRGGHWKKEKKIRKSVYYLRPCGTWTLGEARMTPTKRPYRFQ
jgi:hypothetical protein